MTTRDHLIDVTRLIWRSWSGRLATGIDRVCLAYLDRYGPRAQAVVQRRGLQLVLSPAASDRLFALIRAGGGEFRKGLVRLMPTALASASSTVRCSGEAGPIYFNIGHTGLNEPALPVWIERNRLRAVFLVHDLIPVTHPEFCRAGEAEKHRARMRNVLRCATGIIVYSKATLSDLQDFARIECLPVPPVVSAWISGQAIPTGLAPASHDRPYFVVVGTIEGRKNHVLLFQTWRRLVEQLGDAAPQLLVIGQRGWEAEHAIAMLDRNPVIKGHVLELKNASDSDVNRFIAGARALLMPTFAEGFGLPVIEALQLGTPVICSDLPAFREFAGDIPCYLDPLDGPTWSRTILEYQGDCPDRERQHAALAKYRAPSWESHFATIDPWLETL